MIFIERESMLPRRTIRKYRLDCLVLVYGGCAAARLRLRAELRQQPQPEKASNIRSQKKENYQKSRRQLLYWYLVVLP